MARTLLRQSACLAALREEAPGRHARLEALCAAPALAPRDAWPLPGERDARRAALAAALSSELVVAPPARLLALMGQALRWQRHTGQLPPGGALDLFSGAAPREAREEEELCPSGAHPSSVCPPAQLTRPATPRPVEAKTIRFGKQTHAEAAAFTPDGEARRATSLALRRLTLLPLLPPILQFLVTGSSDGFIEVWDALTGQLRKDLAYQGEGDGAFMVHEAAVLSLAVSLDSELLASGAADGCVKVWRLRSGACVRRYEAAHAGAVAGLCFSRDAQHLLSASTDGCARVHGLRSGRMLRELRGHAGFLSCCAFGPDGTTILTGGADGTVRTWDAHTGEQLGCLRAPGEAGAPPEAPPPPVLSLHHLPAAAPEAGPPSLLLCCAGGALYVLQGGAVVRQLSCGEWGTGGTGFVAALPSRGGAFVHALTDAGALCCFDAASGRMERAQAAHERGAAGLCAHPHRNLLATFGGDGTLKLWRA